MAAVVSWLGARLAEPSTWAGIAVGATAIEQAIQGNPAGIAGLLTGLLAMILPEKSTPPKGS